MDNGSSHRSKATTTWLAAHPRFTVYHTPAHASWLNQVELLELKEATADRNRLLALLGC